MTDLNATWDEKLRGPRMSETTGRVIFKYQMPVLEEFTMDLPRNAEIIRMEDQGGMFWLWAVVNTDAPTEKRFFRAFKTGAAMPDGVELKYVGFCAVFVQMELGLYIFEDVLATQNARAKESIVVKKGGLHFDWVALLSEMVGYDAYSARPNTKERLMLDIDDILTNYKDVFAPKSMNQTQVDIEEARMEDEDDA